MTSPIKLRWHARKAWVYDLICDMAEILRDPDATETERAMAFSTIKWTINNIDEDTNDPPHQASMVRS